MITSFFLAGAILSAFQVALSQPERLALEAHMESRRPEGSGPGRIVAAASADVTGDGFPDVTAVYECQIGPTRNRSGTQWNVVLIAGHTPGSASDHWIIGSKGTRLVERMEIEAGVIHLRGVEYLIRDPQCCPSGEYAQQLTFADGRLRERRGRWWRRP